jgi:serpin B
MTIVRRYARAFAPALAIAGTLMAGPAASDPIRAPDSQVKLLAQAYDTAGQRLFAKLAAAPGNVVFSPYSVGAALSMAL